MKSFLFLVFVLTICSCASTSRIIEYNNEGKVVKETMTKENVSKTICSDLSEKNVVLLSRGWGVKLEVGSRIDSAMAPSLVVDAGKFSSFYGSFMKTFDSATIPDMIKSWNDTLKVGNDGIYSE